MKPAAFHYHDPATIAEALDILGSHENARPLAGGQSLVPMLNFRYLLPDHIVDLNHVDELAGIQVLDNRVRLGAMTRQCSLERSEPLTKLLPIFGAALEHIGHRQTRNRGTIGGSLAHLDPSAELANVAALHDAALTLRSKRGQRTLAFADFAQGYLTTALAEDELLTEITADAWPAHHGYAFEEVARRHGDFAIAAVSALITLDENGLITRAAICVSGVMPVPARLTEAERALIGERESHEALRAVAIEAENLDAMSDVFVSASYRKHLARVLTYRVLQRAIESARTRSNRHV